MNHKMLHQILGNQLVLLEDCKRGMERGVAYNDSMIEDRRRDTIDLLISIERS
jgi:hypothetical protein